ncbi:hypothetical protein AVEN_131863-1 [Araneus ventricosus]|uniref:Uncharacterized protein n=1 Tax=Araneus ventricosus TaxID=182803 RepID=A0A4Y2SFH9_ARAVE|nr:hypothetical protein AVEN_131863-1 [Araneus ventricosus]
MTVFMSWGLPANCDARHAETVHRALQDRPLDIEPPHLARLKIESLLVSVLFRKSLHPRSSLFNPHLLLTGGAVKKASPRIPVNSVGEVHLSESLLAPYLFVPFLLSPAVSQAGDKLSFQSLPLKSSPLSPDWIPGSLCRRFNEDFPLRHLLCPVTHGVGKKLLLANDLGGSYNGHKEETLNILRREAIIPSAKCSEHTRQNE